MSERPSHITNGVDIDRPGGHVPESTPTPMIAHDVETALVAGRHAGRVHLDDRERGPREVHVGSNGLFISRVHLAEKLEPGDVGR